MADPSFDVVSKVDKHEADNAVNQAAREIANRFDFRGVNADVAWAGEDAVTITADTEERARAALEVFREKLVKRGISLKSFDPGEPESSGKAYRIKGSIIQGIDAEKAKRISKFVRDEAPKGVQAQIQGDQLRVTAKKKDTLQEAISLLKNEDFGVALQFTNYR